MLPFDEQFTELDIGAHAAKAHLVRIADIDGSKCCATAPKSALRKLRRGDAWLDERPVWAVRPIKVAS